MFPPYGPNADFRAVMAVMTAMTAMTAMRIVKKSLIISNMHCNKTVPGVVSLSFQLFTVGEIILVSILLLLLETNARTGELKTGHCKNVLLPQNVALHVKINHLCIF